MEPVHFLKKVKQFRKMQPHLFWPKTWENKEEQSLILYAIRQ